MTDESTTRAAQARNHTLAVLATYARAREQYPVDVLRGRVISALLAHVEIAGEVDILLALRALRVT